MSRTLHGIAYNNNAPEEDVDKVVQNYGTDNSTALLMVSSSINKILLVISDSFSAW